MRKINLHHFEDPPSPFNGKLIFKQIIEVIEKFHEINPISLCGRLSFNQEQFPISRKYLLMLNLV